MLAKYPAARPAGAAAAWDRLEGVVSDALGPRWRRDATITGPAVDPAATTEVAPVLPSERSGIYPVLVPPLPVPVPASRSSADHGAVLPVQSEPAPAHPAGAAPCTPTPCSPRAVRPTTRAGAAARLRRRLRRRVLLLALAGALILAMAAILYSTTPGEEPRAAPRPPAGPSLEQRVREAVTPAVRAEGRVSRELSSLVPGASPNDALDRVGAALAATDRARAAVNGLGVGSADDRLLQARAGRALSTQTEYLGTVRATLRLRVDDDRLDALAARLVARLELIETAVPGASESVGGVQPLQRWLAAEIAAAQPSAVAPAATPAAVTPAPTATPATPAAQPGVAPAPTATAPPATPEPTVAPPISAHEKAGRPIHPRRARLRKRLQRLAPALARP